MAESMLAILCHILRGEPVIRERLSKEKEGSRGEEDTGQEEGGSRRDPQVNQQQLQQVLNTALILQGLDFAPDKMQCLWAFLTFHSTKCLVRLARI